MKQNVIRLKNISKEIKGTMVLSDINFVFEPEKIYGLHGRNGSGKTMLLRMISGLIRPTAGQVEIGGKILHKDIDFPESIGVMIETQDFWKNYTGIKVLKTLASIKRQITEEQMAKTLERIGLDPEDKRTIRKYSLGMRQRLGIAQAIMEKPDILLLDEPTNALDKEGVSLVNRLLKEEAARGAIVIIASHNLQDLEQCDQLIEMDNGSIFDLEKRDRAWKF